MTELRRKPDVDYYKVLQVDPEAELEVIEAAYRALSKKYHPDINRAADSMDRMARINSAYDTLSDASKRRDYNYLRSGTARPTTVSSTPARPAPSPASSASSARPSTPPASNGPRKPNGESSGKSSFTPANSPKRESSNGNSSFRPQNTYSNGTPRPAATPKSGLNYMPRPGRGVGLWVGVVCGVLVLAVVVVLVLELIFGNPLRTSFVTQPPPTQAAVVTQAVASTAPVNTPQPAVPTNQSQILSYLNNTDLYASRVSTATLSTDDVLQLQIKLLNNGAILNSDPAVPDHTPDDLDRLRQAESTTYNLVYTLYNHFSDLSRINLVLTDSKGVPFYRADVTRDQAFNFYTWHGNLDPTDVASVTTAAKQDLLLSHLGAPLDQATRDHLNGPSDANLQAELQNLGLTAFSITDSPTPVINYFQVRSDAETAVDFATIVYRLYTRFPSLDQLQIVASSNPSKPSKVINRELFERTSLLAWAEASYGGSTVGGDAQAQTLIAALPGDPNQLKPLAVGSQTKFNTPVQIDTWAVVTQHTDRFTALSLEGQQLPAGNGRTYLVVQVALRNASSGPQWLFPGQNMTLLNTSGPTSYAPDPAATLLYDLKTPPSANPLPGPIDAGKQDAVYVVFNIPANTNLSTLQLQFISGNQKGLLALS